ncbi:hypothetical protein Tco_0285359, partial [Tanacetum coccineum]
MAKVIKGEFKKLESLKINDVSLTCNTSLEFFNEEFNRMSRIDDDLFTYKVEIAEVTNIPCDLKKKDDLEKQMSHESDDGREFDPSNARGDDEVELTDKESSDSEDEVEVTKIFRIETNVFDFETPLCRAFKEFNYLLQIDPDVLTKDIDGFKTYEEYKDDWIYEGNKDVPWVHERPWTDNGTWEEPTPVRHHCKPFNYKNGFSEWPTCSWKDDGYCNGGNLPGAYIIGNTHRYQDLERYEALKDRKLKEEALKNKAIMEGIIDNDDESCNEDEERCEVFDDQERPICDIRRFEMIKYSFGEDEEYVSQYGAFQFMDTEYWSHNLAAKEIDKVGEVSIIWNPVCVVVMLEMDIREKDKNQAKTDRQNQARNGKDWKSQSQQKSKPKSTPQKVNSQVKLDAVTEEYLIGPP